MPSLSRRKFVGSLGAGLLLAPFIDVAMSHQARAAASSTKRLLIFGTMGTVPSMWTPTGISGESITAWSDMTAPLQAIADNLVLIEGLPSGNPNDGHGASDALTGQGFAYYGQGVIKTSVDQFVAQKLVESGVNRPIATLLLGANCNQNGGLSQFYGGATGTNLPTIGSPLSAFNTVFGTAVPTGTSSQQLLARRKSILDIVKAEAATLKGSLGANERAKLDAHLDSIRQLENKLAQSGAMSGCSAPMKPDADSGYQYMNDLDALAANSIHQQILVKAFACDITRVACLEYGNDSKLMVNAPGTGLPYDDQHGGYIHSGASSNYANLVKFESYLATQFVNIVNMLKATPEPLDLTKTLFDTTLVVWSRDMGDAQNHDQKSMRFVLASGNGGYLKTAAGGRYLQSSERHERVLLNLCEAMGITSYTGFGDPMLSTKAPLPGLSI
jgi:hypothetical protein